MSNVIKTVRRTPKSFDTDVMYKNVWKSLARDFRSSLGFDFLREEEYLLDQGIQEFRGIKWPSRTLAPVSYFKAEAQMKNLFKRYRFKDDLYTDQELEELTTRKFLATQTRVASHSGSLPHRAFLVIQKARSIITKILGDYDEQEHVKACRFGKRASVGCPNKESYLDSKLSRPLTGTRDHIEWFKRHLSDDKLLSDSLDQCSPKGKPTYEECDTLALVNVAKSYKTKRSILPNTIIGGFYTYGLGKLYQNRLAHIGLDIRHLQKKHQRLVKLFSKTRTHATADLTAASDSYAVWLVMMLLPRKWFHVTNFGRISKVRTADTVTTMSSFMTMGIGFTFQLQTLLFYGILKAIKELSGTEGMLSVYGDDLIYPSSMHPYVRQIFIDIGFILNDDKTFVRENFRESCGSDCYCGFDVRPFQPEGVCQLLTGRMYVLLLYKTINGLLRRWREHEINITLRYLYSEILRVDDSLLQVPPDFADYSGIKVAQPRKDFLLPWALCEDTHVKECSPRFIWNCTMKVPFSYNSTGIYGIQFPYYKLHARDRAVKTQCIYYWDSLRAKENLDTNEEDRFDSDFRFNPLTDTLSEGAIRWTKLKPERGFRSRLSGRRFKYLQAVVNSKDNPSVIRQTGSTSRWTEDAGLVA